MFDKLGQLMNQIGEVPAFSLAQTPRELQEPSVQAFKRIVSRFFSFIGFPFA